MALVCIDCGAMLVHRPRAKRCETCAEKKKRNYDKNRLMAEKGRNCSYQQNRFKIPTHDEQGDSCIVCGWSLPGVDYGGCIVHHIIPISAGGESKPSNGAVLCPNCHAKTHYGFISEEYLQDAAIKAIARRKDYKEENLERLRDIINAARG